MDIESTIDIKEEEKTKRTRSTKASETKQVEPDNKPMTPKSVDPHTIITVRNGFHGKLIYKSSKTGERFVWDGFGDEQDMEIGELRNARTSRKKYFANNWFMFDEDWIPDYLGVRQFYKYALTLEQFDSLFEKKPEEISKMIAKLSDGQKRSLAYRAKEKVANGEIDSNRLIASLENDLGVELIERN